MLKDTLLSLLLGREGFSRSDISLSTNTPCELLVKSKNKKKKMLKKLFLFKTLENT